MIGRKILIKPSMSFRFCEVHRITEWKDASIYRTEYLGVIESKDEFKINRTKYTTSSFPTKLTRGPEPFAAILFNVEDLQ